MLFGYSIQDRIFGGKDGKEQVGIVDMSPTEMADWLIKRGRKAATEWGVIDAILDGLYLCMSDHESMYSFDEIVEQRFAYVLDLIYFPLNKQAQDISMSELTAELQKDFDSFLIKYASEVTSIDTEDISNI